MGDDVWVYDPECSCTACYVERTGATLAPEFIPAYDAIRASKEEAEYEKYLQTHDYVGSDDDSDVPFGPGSERPPTT